MDILTQENLSKSAYSFIVMFGVIVLMGAVLIYFDKKTKLSKKRKK